MVFLRSLRESKGTQISRTLPSIMADSRDVVVWMVSTRPPISKSSSLSNNSLVTMPCDPVTNSITVTFIFHSFFSSLAKPRYLFLFSLPFSFTLWSARTTKSTIRQLLCFCGQPLGLVVWPRLDEPIVSQNP